MTRGLPGLTPELEVTLSQGHRSRATEITKHPTTLTEFLDSLRNVVAEFDAGYRLGIEDYTNDLSTRSAIEDVAARYPEIRKVIAFM
jgi:hypothetical protein